MSRLTKWKCHKVVRAGLISHISITGRQNGPTGHFYLRVFDEHDQLKDMDIPSHVFNRSIPSRGDYLVIYASEGPDTEYISWSPKATFEAGYTRMSDAVT